MIVYYTAQGWKNEFEKDVDSAAVFRKTRCDSSDLKHPDWHPRERLVPEG